MFQGFQKIYHWNVTLDFSNILTNFFPIKTNSFTSRAIVTNTFYSDIGPKQNAVTTVKCNHSSRGLTNLFVFQHFFCPVFLFYFLIYRLTHFDEKEVDEAVEGNFSQGSCQGVEISPSQRADSVKISAYFLANSKFCRSSIPGIR